MINSVTANEQPLISSSYGRYLIYDLLGHYNIANMRSNGI